MKKSLIPLLIALLASTVACNMADATKRMQDETAQRRTSTDEETTPPPPPPTGSNGNGKTVGVEVRWLPRSGEILPNTAEQVNLVSGIAGSVVWVQGQEQAFLINEDGRTQLTVPWGDQTLVVSPSGDTFKEARHRITVTDQSPQTFVIYVSPDRRLFFDHGKEIEWTFSPGPERVTDIQPVPERGRSAGPQAFRRKNSVWVDGEVQIKGIWEDFYVWTSANQCAVGTATLADPSWYVEYPCPKPVGQLTIVSIDSSGQLISFQSSSGITGTFHLQTREWSLQPELD